MITAGKSHSPKVHWRRALGEYLYSCSAVTFFTEEVSPKLVGTVFYRRTRTAEG